VATIDPRTIRLRHGNACLVRTAVEADAQAMVEHQGHMVRTDPNTVSEPDDQRRTVDEQREAIAAARREDGHLMLVAVQGEHGPVLGALSFRNGDRRKVRHHGHFGISVDADWRGKGVGSALITTLLDWAAAHPVIEKVCLGALETNTGARRLYERLGFVLEHVSPRHFKLGPGRYVADIWMAIYVKPGVAPREFRTWAGS